MAKIDNSNYSTPL